MKLHKKQTIEIMEKIKKTKKKKCPWNGSCHRKKTVSDENEIVLF